MFKKKDALLVFTKYLFIAIVLYLLSHAGIFGLYPFAIGFFLALVFLGANFYASSAIYIATSLLSSFSLLTFFATAIACVVVEIAKLVEMRLKKKIKIGLMVVLCGLSQIGHIYVSLLLKESPLNVFLTVFISTLFFLSNYSFLRAILINKLKYKLLDYEIICGCVLLMITTLGAFAVEIVGLSLAFIIIAPILLLSAYIGGVRSVLVCGISMGIGGALLGNNIAYIACISFMSLLIACFSKSPRIFGAMSAILGYIMLIFYFNADCGNSLYNIISLAIGCTIFLSIPKKQLEKIKNFLCGSFRKTALRYVVNHNRKELANSLFKVSDIFYEMSGLMSGLKKEISDRNVEILYKSLVDDFCSECTKKAVCGSCHQMREALEDVIKTSVIKGRATVIDLPIKVTEGCIKIAQLISFASDISVQYNRYIKAIENENMAKRIVSEQLLGVSLILKDLGIKEGIPVSFNQRKEQEIIDELAYSNVICSEALISKQENGGSITLIILTDCYDRQLIEKGIKKVLSTSYSVTAVEDSLISGFSVVFLESTPKYDVVFGFASCPKDADKSSGDTHSFIKIHNNKFMMALCDGMGSGEKARRFSDTTISLIENFYKAGFDHSLVLESVNKFLSLSSEETFSAVDVCVVDLETAEVDVIKIGTPASYIKNKESVLKVEGRALPIGMLEEMRPSVSTQRLGNGDMVIITTDGISDSFNGDELAAYINHLGCKNPQQLCTLVTEKTLEFSPPRDDMTIAALRIFKRVS